jgi:hypothetical protein
MLNHEYLVGYVNGDNGYERTPITATADNIASFLVVNAEKEDVMITTPLDTPFITARYGIIDKCTDQQFLMFELLPVLIPMQREETEPKPIEVFDETLGFDENAADEYENELEEMEL